MEKPKGKEDETGDCENCKPIMEVNLALTAQITKLLEGKGNLLFTKTTTTTVEYRSDLGAAVLTAIASGQIPHELIGSALEIIGEVTVAQMMRNEPTVVVEHPVPPAEEVEDDHN